MGNSKGFSKPLLIIAAGLLTYLNSLGGALFWDDEVTLINNPFIRGPLFLKEIFLSSYHSGGGETVNFYRPLATVSFMLDYHFWSLHPLGYHLTNVLLHVANALLIFWIVQHLFRKRWLGLFSALLFVVHPVNSEAVNYVSNRTDLLMLFFLLCSLSTYLLYRDQGRPILLFLSIAGYVGSLLSKEMGLVLPLFLLAVDSIEKRSTPVRVILGFLAVFVSYVLLRATVLNFLHLDLLRQRAQARPFSRDIIVRLLTFAKAHLTYLRLFFVPVNLHMEYDNPIVESRLDPTGWLAVALLVVIGVAFWIFGRRESSIRFGGMWYFLGLLPICGIIPNNNVLGEHYLYLASAGFLIMVAVLFLRRFEAQRRKGIPVAAFLGAILLLGGVTMMRNRAWADPLGMYLDIASHTHGSFRANNNAGVEYFRRRDKAKAEIFFRRALEILPTYAEALNNLGVIEEEKGHPTEAQRLYQQSVASKPDYPLARKNLARIYLRAGRLAEARSELLTVLKSYPYDADAQRLLASLPQS